MEGTGVMEYLYRINPLLTGEKPIVLYGIGVTEKKLFYALLQQNVYVTAFCLKENQTTSLKRLFNKRIVSLRELKDLYEDAWVIVTGETAIADGQVLKNTGIENIVIENITLKDKGVLLP